MARQRFRTEHADFFHAVNAYEDHEHVYATLRRRPGTVLVRGGGVPRPALSSAEAG